MTPLAQYNITHRMLMFKREDIKELSANLFEITELYDEKELNSEDEKKRTAANSVKGFIQDLTDHIEATQFVIKYLENDAERLRGILDVK